MLVTATVTGAGWGSAPSFTDDPLNPSGTKTTIKLVHLTELRTAVNQLRSHAGLSAFSFTVDTNPTQYVTTVKADHIRQLRTALEQTLTALHVPIGGYAHPTLAEQSSTIYAMDFQELRDQVKSGLEQCDDQLDGDGSARHATNDLRSDRIAIHNFTPRLSSIRGRVVCRYWQPHEWHGLQVG